MKMVRGLSQDDTFVEFVCDQLERLDGVIHKRMFGGFGLYCGAIFFGIVFRDTLYFKTNAEGRQKYEEWGMGPFQPNAKQKLKSYYEVPADFVEDAQKLTELAEEAVTVAEQG